MIEANDNIISFSFTYFDILSDTLSERCGSLAADVLDIFKSFDNLGDSWTGASYEEFRGIVEKYRDPLNSVAMALQAFATLFKECVVPEIELLKNEINNNLC